MSEDTNDFDDILNRAGTDLPDEAALYPNGTFRLRCAAVAEGSFQTKEGRTIKTVSFGYAVGEPGEDVDQDEWSEVAQDVTGQRIWKRYSLSNSAEIAAFKRDIAAHGIDPNAEGTVLGEQARACKGHEVTGTLVRNFYKTKDGTERRENKITRLQAVA